MIIEFSVSNFRSIKDKQTLSLVKGKGAELQDTHCFAPSGKTRLSLLHSVAVYGANASGKSNLIKAMATMHRLVLRSANDYQRGDELPVTPFLFAAETPQQPSEFEMFFIAGDVRFQYGFSLTKHRVHNEWLFAYPGNRPQLWFSRAYISENNQYDWKLGRQLTGSKLAWQQATRDNALFLSTAIQLNSEQLQPVFDWFKERLQIIVDGELSPGFTAAFSGREGKKHEILKFLKSADLAIDDFVIEEETFDPNKLPGDMPNEIKNMIIENLKDETIVSFKTIHAVEGSGQPAVLNLKEESDGTQKLFAFAGPLLDILEHGYILVVDELHNHLHPALVKFIVGLFHSPVTNPHHAQLVFSTHQTSVLNADSLRRDQIWFCEKNGQQATQLFSLTDFSARKDTNLEQHYLTGRFGAVPYLRRFAPEK